MMPFREWIVKRELADREARKRGSEPTPEHPVYAMVAENPGRATQRYLITWDEGWRQGIVAEGMYEPAARWLLTLMDGRPYGGHNGD